MAGVTDDVDDTSWVLSVTTVLILSLDTTTAAGSCALFAGGRVLREHASDPAVPQATRLPGDLIALLAAEGVALADIEAFAVGVGPGSFTGLRVGIATMQGLALAMGKPLVGVSAFDAMAATAGGAGMPLSDPSHVRIATWVDAWRGEVFAALYDNDREVEPPSVEPPARLLLRLSRIAPVFTGDGAALYAAGIVEALGDRARFTEPIAPLLAGSMAALAAVVLARGDRPLPHAIRPLYVRRSDAELARDRS
jgi:tRNA threonylcarbamoyladenosine biosynthesis protein TsaB